MTRQVADIPKGRSWEEFLEDLSALSGGQVPLAFRTMLAMEAEEPERASQMVRALLDRAPLAATDAIDTTTGLRVSRFRRSRA